MLNEIAVILMQRHMIRRGVVDTLCHWTVTTKMIHSMIIVATMPCSSLYRVIAGIPLNDLYMLPQSLSPLLIPLSHIPFRGLEVAERLSLIWRQMSSACIADGDTIDEHLMQPSVA